MPYCCIKHCKNTPRTTINQEKITFHRFPGHRSLLMRWIEAVNKNYENSQEWKPDPYDTICSAHFRDSDMYYPRGEKCKALRPNAVPTKHLTSWTPAMFKTSKITSSVRVKSADSLSQNKMKNFSYANNDELVTDITIKDQFNETGQSSYDSMFLKNTFKEPTEATNVTILDEGRKRKKLDDRPKEANKEQEQHVCIEEDVQEQSDYGAEEKHEEQEQPVCDDMTLVMKVEVEEGVQPKEANKEQEQHVCIEEDLQEQSDYGTEEEHKELEQPVCDDMTLVMKVEVEEEGVQPKEANKEQEQHVCLEEDLQEQSDYGTEEEHKELEQPVCDEMTLVMKVEVEEEGVQPKEANKEQEQHVCIEEDVQEQSDYGIEEEHEEQEQPFCDDMTLVMKVEVEEEGVQLKEGKKEQEQHVCIKEDVQEQSDYGAEEKHEEHERPVCDDTTLEMKEEMKEEEVQLKVENKEQEQHVCIKEDVQEQSDYGAEEKHEEHEQLVCDDTTLEMKEEMKEEEVQLKEEKKEEEEHVCIEEDVQEQSDYRAEEKREVQEQPDCDDTTLEMKVEMEEEGVQIANHGDTCRPSAKQWYHPQPPQDKQNFYRYKYGSGSESDGSDDDELVAPVIPRSARIFMDTPVDDAGPSSDSNSVSFSNNIMYNFKWKPLPNPPIQPESRKELFSVSEFGSTSLCTDPYNIFIDIWDRKFMQHIAIETNRYSLEVTEEIVKNNEKSSESKKIMQNWKETNADELYVYFAIILAMGIVVKSRIEEYWNSSLDLFSTPGFSVHMSLERFESLNRCIHFNNNKNMFAHLLDVDEARLFKIEPVVTHLNKKFQSLYIMRQDIALDESLLKWKISSETKKASEVGIKTFELYESQTGYLWRFVIHAHKRSEEMLSEDPLQACTPSIVVKLLHGLENKGYIVWMDNFYSSPILARKLKTLGFDCVGTLRTNRQFVPEALNQKSTADMETGEIAGFTSGDIDLLVWKDQNRVAAISTYHGNFISEHNGTLQPALLLDYSIMLDGLDQKDQMLSKFPLEKKGTTVWYKKLFRRLLNISVLNAYILYKQSQSQFSWVLSDRDFRISLISEILQNHSHSSFRQLPADARCLPEKHHLAFVLTKTLNNNSDYKCAICQKLVMTYCVGCNKRVCKTPCFVSMHEPTSRS